MMPGLRWDAGCVDTASASASASGVGTGTGTGEHLNGCRARWSRGGSLARNAACGTKINFAKVPTEN